MTKKKKKPTAGSHIFSLAGRPDSAWLIQQAEGRERLLQKVPSWGTVEGLHLPQRLSLEQCSNETTARYKAELAARLCPQGGSMADLTGGFGVDFSFIAPHFDSCLYNERDASLCDIVRHNVVLLGLEHTRVQEGEAEAVLEAMESVDFLLLDPARRDMAGRKVVRLEDCQPNVAALHDRLREKSSWTMIKLSPMLDISEALRRLPSVVELHIVAVGGECKELLLVLGEQGRTPQVYCVDGAHRFVFTYEEERLAVAPMAEKLGDYLFEPSAAVMKGGAFRTLCQRYHLQKLHPNTHLYTADHDVAHFPGRRFRISQVSGFSKKEVRPLAGTKANLSVRNFPDTVAALRRRLRLADGGNDYLFATTVGAKGERRLLRCVKVEE